MLHFRVFVRIVRVYGLANSWVSLGLSACRRGVESGRFRTSAPWDRARMRPWCGRGRRSMGSRKNRRLQAAPRPIWWENARGRSCISGTTRSINTKNHPLCPRQNASRKKESATSGLVKIARCNHQLENSPWTGSSPQSARCGWLAEASGASWQDNIWWKRYRRWKSCRKCRKSPSTWISPKQHQF